ncbi:MAG: HAAS signaling domain-containing protein [Candidatus Dormibacteria bacterium]
MSSGELVERYLAEVGEALGSLPAAERDEILSGLREHITIATADSPADPRLVATVIERLGPPGRIALEALGHTAPATASLQPAATESGGARPRTGPLELAVVLLIALAGTLPWSSAWVVAAGLIWYSRGWRNRDRLLGLYAPAALALAATFLLPAVMSVAPHLLPPPSFGALILLSAALPFAAVAYLLTTLASRTGLITWGITGLLLAVVWLGPLATLVAPARVDGQLTRTGDCSLYQATIVPAVLGERGQVSLSWCFNQGTPRLVSGPTCTRYGWEYVRLTLTCQNGAIEGPPVVSAEYTEIPVTGSWATISDTVTINVTDQGWVDLGAPNFQPSGLLLQILMVGAAISLFLHVIRRFARHRFLP